MAFISLQQALQRVFVNKQQRQAEIDARVANHDGFVGASPSQVFARYEQRLAQQVFGDDDFPEFE